MSLKRTYTTYTTNSRAAARSYRGAAIDRDALVEAHLPQVKFIADRLAAKLPPSVDREDLIGAGVLGLLDAVDKFDPERGVQFKTYAEMRVRGAMLDSLRSLDWAPRSMRLDRAMTSRARVRGTAAPAPKRSAPAAPGPASCSASRSYALRRFATMPPRNRRD